jgi:hypothetical protein
MTCLIILVLLHVFVAAITCLPSRSLVIKGEIHFTEPLPTNDRRDKPTDTQGEGFMKYAVEIGSDARIYIQVS